MLGKLTQVLLFLQILFLFSALTVVAEIPTHYIYRGEPRYMQLDTKQLAIIYQTGLAPDNHQSILTRSNLSIVDELATGSPDWYFMTHSTTLENASDLNARIEEFILFTEIEFVSPIFIVSENAIVAITPDIMICVKSEYINQAQTILAELAPGAEIIDDSFGNMPGAYVIRPDARNGFEVLALANALAGDDRIK